VIDFAVNLLPRVGPLPPSAKLVHRVFMSDGRLTQKDLIERTVLPSRTVRYAIGRLRKKDLLVEHFHLLDARQSLYSLSGTAEV
jgi:DNA-binding MarR family transcriptional regulator